MSCGPHVAGPCHDSKSWHRGVHVGSGNRRAIRNSDTTSRSFRYRMRVVRQYAFLSYLQLPHINHVQHHTPTVPLKSEGTTIDNHPLVTLVTRYVGQKTRLEGMTTLMEASASPRASPSWVWCRFSNYTTEVNRGT